MFKWFKYLYRTFLVLLAPVVFTVVFMLFENDNAAAGTFLVLILFPVAILLKLILKILFNWLHSFNHTKVISL